MGKRRYHQRCGLALALDRIGERWSLLLVRELLCGPRRFGELQSNLGGIGPNLLTRRLRELEEAGIVRQEGRTYSLTERGRTLEDAVVALARWGQPDLPAAPKEDHWDARWNAIALKAAFRPEKARGATAILEYTIDDHPVQARIEDGRLEVREGRPWTPDLTIRTDGETLLAVTAGERDPREAEAKGRLALAGRRALFRRSLRWFEIR